jgi:hypothetical protein
VTERQFSEFTPLAQLRSARQATPVKLGYGAAAAAQLTTVLGIIAFFGEHGADPRHDGEGGQE